MRLIRSSYEFLPQESGLDGIYRQIELAGRTCYKSEDKITEDSAKKFVDFLIQRGHHSPLEHGTVYLKFTYASYEDNLLSKYDHNPYSKVCDICHTTDHQVEHTTYVTTNMRVLVENKWLDDLQYLCEPCIYHHKRVTVRMHISIGISRKFNRHRTISPSEQSTRYCNYSKDKFNRQITYVIPYWCPSLHEGDIQEYSPFEITNKEVVLMNSWHTAQVSYMQLIDLGAKPQDARVVLPLETATEVVYTGFTDDWKHFFDLRCSSGAHPDARAIAEPLYREFIEKGFIIERV